MSEVIMIAIGIAISMVAVIAVMFLDKKLNLGIIKKVITSLPKELIINILDKTFKDTSREQIEDIYTAVLNAVNEVDKMFVNGQVAKEKRKEVAIEITTKFLGLSEIGLSDLEVKIISYIIELLLVKVDKIDFTKKDNS